MTVAGSLSRTSRRSTPRPSEGDGVTLNVGCLSRGPVVWLMFTERCCLPTHGPVPKAGAVEGKEFPVVKLMGTCGFCMTGCGAACPMGPGNGAAFLRNTCSSAKSLLIGISCARSQSPNSSCRIARTSPPSSTFVAGAWLAACFSAPTLLGAAATGLRLVWILEERLRLDNTWSCRIVTLSTLQSSSMVSSVSCKSGLLAM
mmetsp:Transcript_137037/g.324666  ORF Transcript_137037/g.324666 Transcript_137037/m.324666 type:complete len:201 (-) Transcript_137037:649-1251(-)